MAFSLNKVFLIGNLGKEPEHRTTNDGLNVAKYSLATSRRYKNKDGQWADETTGIILFLGTFLTFLKVRSKRVRRFVSKAEFRTGIIRTKRA
jgi:single-strand DNA-binding protein